MVDGRLPGQPGQRGPGRAAGRRRRRQRTAAPTDDSRRLFSVAFAKTVIELVGDNCREVVDPFGGTGSTLIACAVTGRVGRLIELDPRFCDVIRRRWTRWAVKNEQDPGPGALDA